MSNKTITSDRNAGVAFYGRQAGVADVPKITAPLLFDYAGNDQGVNAGIAAYEAALKENKKKFESFTYEGKQHGFHNDTTPRYDAEAAKLAWGSELSISLRRISGDLKKAKEYETHFFHRCFGAGNIVDRLWAI